MNREGYAKTLERIAGHPECTKAIYNMCADALCWAREFSKEEVDAWRAKK